MSYNDPHRPFPVHLNCPHCHNPIEIVAANIDDEILCPSCGSSFHVDPDRTKPISCEKPVSFGKFELIEVVGRGAFGAVYRARDTQLQRIVAVKVPRTGQLSTLEDEDRFVREARNAAQLNHPSIVPVHEVGRSDTFPYIVSEFVEGVTLADTLTDKRLGFRKSAQLVARVAEALQHAHSQGVVHRDLKPSNIMLTADGTPRVMDFGLAKRDAGEITMTIEGQVLGTPAYMSPEQASGQAHHVDGRSDVYSLGVILFELLTGELPFRGNQRMLLHHVIHDEPRAPRSLNDRVPRDLETVCLKAMAKEPGRRYQTAQELADDLQRYLAGKPIEARPVGRVERSWRWCRRNPVVASLSTAMALALVSGTATSTYFAIRATAERDRADAQANEAIAERERAEEGFREARETVDKYFTSVSENKLLNVPGLQPLRKELLESALEHYQKFIGRYGADPKVQAEMAKAYVRVGKITNSIASQEQSLAAFEKAIEIWERLVRANPTATNYLDRLARAYHDLGNVQSETGRQAEAESSYQRAIKIHEGLVHDNPTATDHQDGLANAYNGLGNLLSNTDRIAEAEVEFKKAIEIYDTLVAESPSAVEYQDGLALAYNNLAGVQSNAGRSSAAQGSFQKAIEIHGKLARENPTISGYQDGLALAYNNHGVAEGQWGRWADAEASYQKAFEIYRKLVRENPTVTDYQHRLAGAYQNLGSTQNETGRHSEAEASYQSAIDIREALVRENPTVGDYQRHLAYSYLGLGHIRAVSGEWKESAALFAKGAAIENGSSFNLSKLAMAQFAAGDEAGYRATCADLLARFGANAKGTDAYDIALACVVGAHAVEDTSGVVAVAKRAVASNPVCQVVLGAAQFRDGRTNEAIATLTVAMPLHPIAILVAPQMADAIRVSQLFGEVVLALCYQDKQDKRAVQLQVEKVRALITKLENSPRQSHQAFVPWAVPFGIEIAKRELARIELSATTSSEGNPK